MKLEQKLVEYQGLQTDLESIQKLLDADYHLASGVTTKQGALLFFARLPFYRADCAVGEGTTETVKKVAVDPAAPAKKRGRPKKVKTEPEDAVITVSDDVVVAEDSDTPPIPETV